MTTDARGKTVPAATDHPARAAILNLSLSIRDAIPVASAAARTTALATLAALSPTIVPSSSNPFYFDQADQPPGLNLLRTTDGVAFTPVGTGLPHVSFRKVTPQSITSGASDATLVLDASPTDIVGTWANASGVVTLPYVGRYRFEACAVWAVNTAGTRGFNVTVNGTSVRIFQDDSASGAVRNYVNASFTKTFAAGDNVQFRFFQSSGAALTIGELGGDATHPTPVVQIYYLGSS
jgi:hypothetical protein